MHFTDFLMSITLLAIGFFIPFLVAKVIFGAPLDISLLTGWMCCSLLLAWMMGGDDQE